MLSVVAAAVALTVGGCGGQNIRATSPQAPAPAPAPLKPASQTVVEEYLRAAAAADGQSMYSLLATSERRDETPQSLKDTAHDRYSPGMTWQILKVEETGNTSNIIVEFKGAKVDPNPYRFTLTQEAGAWRVVQTPELHEDDNDIKIKL